ncbi:hypothetical protein [Paenibacillus sp. IHBB 10380]|uniref:hypothetical protein n=1 Tax=Paenibacillus sp. IHBB 10380 TaxID=1566358 RepID=UPI0005CFC7B7|nr:hypothetical protein [Paenibacillus sp. IHBB 10380]AJS59887.1 hypothetical protein UB51_16965 [Paenibacillus sp. IHBB 10380]
MTHTNQLAQAYVVASKAMQTNTKIVVEALAEGHVESDEFRKLWIERDSLYLSLNNATALLRELPLEDALTTYKEIERLRTHVTQ